MARKQFYSLVHRLFKNNTPDESSINIHCHKRIRIMLTMGLISRKIVEKKRIAEVKIDFNGAKIQDGRGSKDLRTEAAHNLPCNILINGYSTWEYVNDPECNFHERIKKQLFLLSASTVIVLKGVNYIDSQWEKNGIIDVLIGYLYKCINIKTDSENEIELLFEAGMNFINGCKITLEKTEEAIKNRKIYRNKKDILGKIFKKYNCVITNFNYKNTINNILGIYRLPQYK